MTEATRRHAGELINIFSTPLISTVWEDCAAMNADLLSHIETRAAQDAGIKRANEGGWHSKLDLLDWDTPGTEMFKNRLTAMATELAKFSMSKDALEHQHGLRITAWANRSGPGHYHALHDHPGSHWSGVYYVTGIPDDPDRPMAGALEMMDPRLGVSMLPLTGSTLNDQVLIRPQPGRVVCFPGWLKHFVHPFYRDGHRISISFNIKVEPLTNS